MYRNHFEKIPLYILNDSIHKTESSGKGIFYVYFVYTCICELFKVTKEFKFTGLQLKLSLTQWVETSTDMTEKKKVPRFTLLSGDISKTFQYIIRQ